LTSHAAASSDDVDEPLQPVLPTHNRPSLSYPTQERKEASSHPQVLPWQWARHLKPCRGADCCRRASSSDSSCRSHLLAAATTAAAATTTTTNVVAATAATTSAASVAAAAASVAAAAATYCASTRLSGGS